MTNTQWWTEIMTGLISEITCVQLTCGLTPPLTASFTDSGNCLQWEMRKQFNTQSKGNMIIELSMATGQI